MGTKRTSLYMLAAVLFAYLALVGTHKGEFWPFSIFPMFSQGGKPWTKTLVRDASNVKTKNLWKPVNSLRQFPGRLIAINKTEINQNDLSNLISKTKTWNREQISELRLLFQGMLTHRRILIYKVTGKMKGKHVKIHAVPFVLLGPDTTIFNNDHQPQ